MEPNRALEVIFSRGFNLGYSAFMCLAFGAVALWGYNEGAAQLVWTFGAGTHFGMFLMWLVSPRITEKWREEMRAELDQIAEEAMAQMHANILAEFPCRNNNQYGRSLQ